MVAVRILPAAGWQERIAQSEFYTSVSEMGIIAGSRSAAPAGVGRCSLIWKESSGASQGELLDQVEGVLRGDGGPVDSSRTYEGYFSS